jgi:signal transduction histidine kinase/ligand-binding sensor domain-containing protein/CheY-like chemotaxis protein
MAGLISGLALWAHQPDLAGLRHDAWQTDNGLPHDVVRTFAQTPDGYLWIGMTNALAHFDGVRIVRVAPQQLVATQVTGSTVDRDGRLIVATLAGVYRLDGETLVPVVARKELSSVRSVAASRNGDLWMGAEHGLYRFRPDRRETTRFLADQFVNKVVVDAGGTIWAGTQTGLFRISPEGHTTGAWLRGTAVTSLFPDGGTVLAGTDGSGLHSIRPDGSSTRLFQRELGTHVMAIRRDRSGDLWVGTWERGLFLISGSSVTQPVGALAGGVQVVSLFEDLEGNIWAGSRGSGMHRLRRHAVRNLTVADGLPHPLAWAVTQTPDGTVWIGTDGGLASVRYGRVRKYTEADGMPGRVITSVAAAPDGTVYAGTPGYGVARIRNGRAQRMHLPDSLGSTLNHVYVTRNGHLWVSTMKGIIEIEGDTVIRRITRAEGLPSNGVRSVIEAPDGAMWASTATGAVRIAGSDVRVFGKSNGIEVPNVRSITPMRDGAVWLATQGGGLCRLTDGRATCFGRDRGMPDTDIYAAIPDGRGYLWLPSAVGIHRVSIAELERIESDSGQYVPLFSLGQSDGMGTDTCTGGIQPGAHLAADGTLWVPTLKGVAAVNVNHLMVAQPLRPIVERVSRAGEYGRNLQIDFTAPLLSGGRRVRFRYRLEPFDAEWIEVNDRRTVWYTNLPPGTYSFHLAARNQDSEWVETANPSALTLEPRYYEIGWVRGTAAMSLAAAVLLFIQWRLKAAVRRRRELTRMVEERTQELELARSRLERADQAKSNFLSFISHEIRTPLNGILAMTSLWHTFRREEEHRQALETIESCGEALLGIVNNVLDLTRIEAGRLDLEEAVFSPRSLVERAVSVVSMQAAKKGLDLRSSVADPMPEAVRADGTRLRQVLLNLLGNAVKFTARGSIELLASAAPEGSGQWRLRFSVRDTGLGIAPELLPSLFEPFSHASSSTGRQYGGSGLGLSISQRIVRAMNGDIGVKSEPGVGSTFEFDVLVTEAVPEPAQDEAPAFPDPFDSPEVLVVEDNRVNQMVAARMLATLGCRVEVAENGEAALRLLASSAHDFRVVFMDCMMPELDGYETTRRIRQMPGISNLPVVAISADAFSWSRDRAFAAGMNSYLTKPLRIEEVRRELAAWAAPRSSR